MGQEDEGMIRCNFCLAKFADESEPDYLIGSAVKYLSRASP